MTNKIKGTKKAKRINSFAIINPDAAGIDIGNTEISVAISPEKCQDNVRTFGTFTRDFLEVVTFLKEHSIKTVAMECTGVYWVHLYTVLEKNDIRVVVANARYIKNVSGRKDDENDAMWIQRLHSCGLISGSFQPDWPFREFRDLMRHRRKLLGDRNRCVNRLIKALVLMNIKVQNVISDIDGKTGKAIIQAIANGETNAEKLADLADIRIKASRQELVKSLEGDWNEHQLFILKQQHLLYKHLSEMIYATDLQVEKQLKRILAWRHEGQMIEVDLQLKRKRATAKNNLPFNATAYLQTLLRTDLTAITGINELSALTFISEVGMDMERWPSTKNFRSWLNIAPLTEVTGGKIQSEKTKRRFHHAGQVLRIAAITVRNTDTSLGHIFRKNMARGGPSKAILSVADKMATAIYHMIRNQVPYDPNTSDKVREKEKINLIKHLEKRLEKLKLAT
jgi:transposase